LHSGRAGTLLLLLAEAPPQRPAVQAFLAALRNEKIRDRIAALGMTPAY